MHGTLIEPCIRVPFGFAEEGVERFYSAGREFCEERIGIESVEGSLTT